MAITYVTLNAPSQSNGLLSYNLKLGIRMDAACRTGLVPFLKGNKLEMEENEDHIVIFSRQ
jgi:hypothetical protein